MPFGSEIRSTARTPAAQTVRGKNTPVRRLLNDVAALLTRLSVAESEAAGSTNQELYSQSARLLNGLRLSLQSESDARAALAVENQALLAAIADTRLAVDEHRAAAEDARYRASHDNLTGLPNREYFKQRLHTALAALASPEAALGVLYLDLDGFKAVNDQHGHHVGDELLQIVAARLSQTLRVNDMVSRFGGDEFACLLVGFADVDHMMQMAARLFQAIAAPVHIGAAPLVVTPSIGLAVAPRHGSTADDLLRNADQAMFQAKRARLSYVCADLPPPHGAVSPA